MTGDFAIVHRPHGDCWLHKGGRAFIVFYEATDVRAAHFMAYESKAAPPKGRYPWTVDNRRIRADRGFASFEDAAAAVHSLFAEVEA